MRGTRNNLLAGALVLGALFVAGFCVVLLAGGLEVLGKRAYKVQFGVEDGVAGLEPGSRVLVGGLPVGVVDRLAFVPEQDGTVKIVDVFISIDRSIIVREGAVAQLIAPLLGGSGTINFPTVGEGRAIGSSDPIEGEIAPPTLLASAGYGDEQKKQVQNIIKRVSDASDKIDTFLDDLRPTTADIRQKWPQWSARVDSITKNVDDTTARGPVIAKDIEDRLAQWRDTVEEGRKAIATAQGYLDENRENVRETISSFKNVGAEGEKFMNRLNSELAQKTSDFLDSAKSAFATAEEAMEGIELLREEQLPNIRRMMANFRLASDQLSATLQEVRRSPWRLLYRPDARELNFELLYDSARSYAAAVSDLRNAAESLQSIKAGTPDAAASQPDRVAALMTELETAFERYRDVESEFLRQVKLHSQGK